MLLYSGTTLAKSNPSFWCWETFCAWTLQSISDWGAGQLLPRALPAACSWRAPSSLGSVRRSSDVMPSSSEPLSVESTALPSYRFAWLDSTQSAWQIKALLKKAVLERALEEPCCLPWPGGVAVGGGAGGGLEGSGVRGVSCHNARDSPRPISAAALPPTAEELLPLLGGKRSRFGRSPTQLSKQDTPSGARERGEVSRLEGEGRAIALSLLHSSLERNWVFEPKVAVCRPGERGSKWSVSFGGEKGGTYNAFSTNLQSQGQQRRKDTESNGS